MKVRKLAFGVFAALLASASSSALAATITTNMNGADAEVREEEINADLFGVPQGANRGTSNELATRIRDDVGNFDNNQGNDRTSAMYLKFDISSLTPASLAGKEIRLQLTVRNSNLSDSRRRGFADIPGSPDPNPGAFANLRRSEFSVRGLTNLSAANYDWLESGAGSLTWYNAPGITPDCMDENACDNDPGTFNFNGDAPVFGNFNLFNSGGYPTAMIPGYTLAVGSPFVTYVDSVNGGEIKQLILDAIAGGKSHITLVVNAAHPGRNEADGTPVDGESPTDFINFNYLVNPKEMITLNDHPAFDPDGSGPGAQTGSPYSCDGLPPNPNSANCPGSTLGDNSTGRFSPKLIITVPEPASAALAGLGLLAALSVVRRRK
jgi:hypothetical protein